MYNSWDCIPLKNRRQNHTEDTDVWSHFSCTQNREETLHRAELFEHHFEPKWTCSIEWYMMYYLEDFSAFMCYVTVIPCRGGAEKVDDHAHIFWGFSVVLAGLLLIDTFALSGKGSD